MRPILLLGGRLAAGKDTVADYLAESRGFVKIGMSDTLAEALRRLNPIVSVAVDETPIYYQDVLARVGYVEAKKYPEVRRLLQVLGTEVGRDLIAPNLWVDLVRRKIAELIEDGAPGVCLTGIRYPNELDIEAIAGTDIDLTRHPDVISTSVFISRGELLTEGGVGAHTSENSLGPDDFEYLLQNDGAVGDLQRRTDELISRIEKDYFE